MKLACAYYRMSKDIQEASIPAQRDAVRKWAKANGWTIIAEYFDEGISGDDTGKRVKFQQMIRDAQAGKFQAIIVWEIGRLGRFDAIEGGYWLFPIRQAGVKIITLDRGELDWHDFAGRIVWGVEQEMKHSFLTGLARDVLRGKLAAARDGKWCGGPAPTGYDLRDGQLYVNHLEAELVRQCFADYLRGLSLRGLAEKLNAGTIRAPRGGPWVPVSIQSMLTTETYLGKLVYNKTSISKYMQTVNGDVKPRQDRKVRTRHNAEEEWIEIPDWCEPIIDQATFDAVQMAMASRSTCTTPIRNGGDYLFTGILWCGKCGSRMGGWRNAADGSIFWICQGYMKRGKSVCDRNSVNQAKLLDLVVRQLMIEAARPINSKMLKAGSGTLAAPNRKESADAARSRLTAADGAVKQLKARLCEVDSDMVPVVQERLREALREQDAARTALDQAAKPVAVLALERDQNTEKARALIQSLDAAVYQAERPKVRALLQACIERIDIWADGEKHGKRTFWSISRGIMTLATVAAIGLVQWAPAKRTSYKVKFRGKRAV